MNIKPAFIFEKGHGCVGWPGLSVAWSGGRWLLNIWIFYIAGIGCRFTWGRR